MTALSEYQRLEASGLWRASPEDQRSDVIVSIGDATLVITDLRENPLAHWSLARIIPATEIALDAILEYLFEPSLINITSTFFSSFSKATNIA